MMTVARNVLLTAAWSSLCTEAVERTATSSATGLRRLAQRSEAAAHDVHLTRELRADAPTVVPLPNDTISQAYWDYANRLIDTAGRSTPAPVSANDPLLHPTRPPLTTWEKLLRDPQPYNTELGAQILSSFGSRPTATPPPSQELINQQQIAKCPLIMFKNQIYISAPHCANPLGTWADPETGRAILRWKDGAGGSLMFGVDSRVSGNGSALFAEIREKATVNENRFGLTNCFNAERYTIEERLTRVNKMGHSRTTMKMHDISKGSEAFFLEYLIRDSNGTLVAKSGFDRLNQHVVNISMVTNEGMTMGDLLATATREGVWTQAGWRQCTQAPREWRVQFWVNQHDEHQVASVLDMRVAATAVFTLMAYRDEFRDDKTGFTAVNASFSLFWHTLGRWIFCGMVALVVLFGCMAINSRFGNRIRASCFRVEAYMRKNPRRPVFHTTW